MYRQIDRDRWIESWIKADQTISAHLGQNPCPVDTVDCCQVVLRAEFLVVKEGLDDRLTVVEATIHLHKKKPKKQHQH